MLPILFSCLFATIVMVQANPVSPACPICQQNTYPYQAQNAPLVLQHSAMDYNPYSQFIMDQNPMSQSCQSPLTTYPQFPTSYNHESRNNQQSSSNNDLNQLFVEGNYHNGEETGHVPAVTQGDTVPNIINNYIIIPPELLINNTKNKQDNSNRGRRRKAGQRKAKSRRRHNQGDKDDAVVKSETTETQSDSSRDNKKRKVDPRNAGDNRKNTDAGDRKRKRRKNGRRRSKPKSTNEQAESKTEGKEIKTNLVKLDNVNESSVSNEKPINSISSNINKANIMNYQNFENVLKQDQIKLNETKALNVNASHLLPNSNNTEKYNNIQLTNTESNKAIIKNVRKPIKDLNGVSVNTNAVQRNPLEEAVIRDLQQRFPGISNDVVENILSYMKPQAQKEQKSSPSFYYPQFPMYNHFYQTQLMGGNNHNNARQQHNKSGQRNHGINQNKRKPLKIKTTNTNPVEVGLRPTLNKNEANAIPTAGEKIPEIQKSNNNKSSKDKTSSVDKSDKTLATDNKTTPQISQKLEVIKVIDSNFESNSLIVPELGAEDVVPVMNVNGIVDDYYPDFRADNQAFVFSTEQYYSNNIEGNRYYYTTDRNYEVEQISKDTTNYKQHLKSNDLPNEKNNSNLISNTETVNKDKDKENYNDEVENTIPRPKPKESSVEDIEEIQFQIPPRLETPNFETKKVDQIDTYLEEYENEPSDKISTYSKAKTSQYTTKANKSNEIKKELMPKKVKKDVETFYARSKVMKYGQTPEYSTESSTTPMTVDEDGRTSKVRDDKTDGNQANEQDATIVIAKSIPGQYW